MVNYDGPSFFRKRHPNVEPLKQKKKPSKEAADQKVSWVDKQNQFENIHEDSLPKHIQTRADLQKEALEYMQTPPSHSVMRESKQAKAIGGHFTKKEKTEGIRERTPEPGSRGNESRYYFKSKYIPTSLQNLDGWTKVEENTELIEEVTKRLEKSEDSYLLFANALVPSVEIEDVGEVAETAIPKKQAAKPQKSYNKQRNNSKNKVKVQRVQQEMKSTLGKPSTGLHRSLSNIMAEDQKSLNNGKKSLNKLFQNGEKN